MDSILNEQWYISDDSQKNCWWNHRISTLQTFKKQKECGARKDRFISTKLVFISEAPGKNKDEKEIVIGILRQLTFCVKLAEGDIDLAIIEEFAKDKNLI